MNEEVTYTSMYSRNAELYHHGIKGQKWGVRNGPPYPLDSDVSTGSRLKKNSFSSNRGPIGGVKKKDQMTKKESQTKKSKSVKDFINEKRNDWNNLSKEEKKKKLNKAVAVTNLAIGLGLMAGYVINMFKPLIDVKTEIRDHLNENEEDLNYKTHTNTQEEDIQKVNPHYNPYEEQWSSNCGLCSVTYEMRRRGYDVTAMPSTAGRLPEDIAKMYNLPFSDEHPEVKHASSRLQYENIFEDMPDGARGVTAIRCGDWGSGHALAWEKQDGKVMIIDAQDGIVQDLDSAFDTGRISEKASKGYYNVIRLDDAFPNERVKDACRNYQGLDEDGLNTNKDDIVPLYMDRYHMGETTDKDIDEALSKYLPRDGVDYISTTDDNFWKKAGRR